MIIHFFKGFFPCSNNCQKFLNWLQFLSNDYNYFNYYKDYNYYSDYNDYSDRDRGIESDFVNLWLSDTRDFYWQIAKLESWHWVVVIYNQIVTWTAFAILAMFFISDTNTDRSFN